MLTRRRFLVGTGVGVGLGAAVGAAATADRLAQARGIDPAAYVRDALGMGPTVTSHSFASRYRRTDVHWTVTLPHGSSAENLPLALALHARGGDAASVNGWLYIDDALESYVRGGGTPFAVVAVDGGADSFWHPRTDGTDPLRMITDELLPRLTDVGLRTDRIAVTGWSMGGLGALNLAREQVQGRLHATEVVAAVATAPAIFTSASAAVDGAFDDAAQFTRWGDLLADPGVDASVALRVDCGSSDSLAPAVATYRADVSPTPDGGFVDGDHDAPTWRGLLPDQLAFLGRHLTTT